ncbi:class I SAM-dependent methyltransferase [Acidobacteria bacterium AH-259-L09]|nr:class I SAM-dependent methyltransferase [Acidobacteria bacterium AH-259-L09]
MADFRKLEDYRFRDGIYFPRQETVLSRYKLAWDDNVSKDHIEAAIGQYEGKREDYATLTSQVKIFKDFPTDRHFDSILEIGCGYGRIPLYLSKEKNLSCNRYYGVDLSEKMLRHLLGYNEQYNFLPSAEIVLICQSAGILPLEDDSIDCVVSSAVFCHMAKESVKKALAEISRIIKPGGVFIFEDSFPNRNCFANMPTYIRTQIPIKLVLYHKKYYSKDEIKDLFSNCKIRTKCPNYVIEPTGYKALPKHIGKLPVPFAKTINRTVRSFHAPKWVQSILTSAYRVYTDGF